MKQLGLAYHEYHARFNRAPAKAEDLAPFLEKDSKPLAALKEGRYVFLYGASLKNMTAGTSNTVLAYEKDTPSKGGLVLMADASVKTMTAEEFKKAPKAKGK